METNLSLEQMNNDNADSNPGLDLTNTNSMEINEDNLLDQAHLPPDQAEEQETCHLTKNHHICLQQIQLSSFDFHDILTTEILNPISNKKDLPSFTFSHEFDRNCQATLKLLRVFPLGIERIHGFQMEPSFLYSDNYKAYLIPNDSTSLRLTIIDPSESISFLQITYLEELTMTRVTDTLKEILSIPDYLDLNGTVYFPVADQRHQINFQDLVSQIVKQYSLSSFNCKICNYRDAFYVPSNLQNIDFLLDIIKYDHVKAFRAFLEKFTCEHVFYSNSISLPKLLRNGPSFLSLCAFYSAHNCFKLLLETYGDDPDLIHKTDNSHRSPIHFASYSGNIDIVRTLLLMNESFDLPDGENLKPIHYAMMGNQNTDFLIAYIEMRGRSDFYDNNNIDHLTPLHKACEYGNLKTIAFYCEHIHSVDTDFLNKYCPNSITPLHSAFLSNHKCVKYFYKNNLFRIQFEFNECYTPLDYAAEKGNDSLIFHLYSRTNFQRFDYCLSPKSYFCAIQNGHSKIVEFYASQLIKTPDIGWLFYCYIVQCGMTNLLTFLDFDLNDNESIITFNSKVFPKLQNAKKSRYFTIPMVKESIPDQIPPDPPRKCFEPRKIEPCPYANNPLDNETQDEYRGAYIEPYSLWYFRNQSKCPIQTLKQLSECVFDSDDKVLQAVQNLSYRERKNFSIDSHSKDHSIQISCSDKQCAFKMNWTCNHQDNKRWRTTSYFDHSCTEAQVPKIHARTIDKIIHTFSLTKHNRDGALAMAREIIPDLDKRHFRDRLDAYSFTPDDDYYWRIFPSFLDNNIQNGGLSDKKMSQGNTIDMVAQLPQYAKCLLESDAILPVILVDGTFLASGYRGNLVVVMVVSSNRTNIPIAWGWGPSENGDLVEMVLNLVKQVKPDIKTVISDQGTGINRAVHNVFPEALHHYCAWHISKKIKSPKLRSKFWELLKAEHKNQFEFIMHQILAEFPEDSKDLRVLQFTNVQRFFEDVTLNGLVASSPVESINSEIKDLKLSHPIHIFQRLGCIGVDRCIKLLNLKTAMTPYYLNTIKLIQEKADNDLYIIDDSNETIRIIGDSRLEMGLRRRGYSQSPIQFLICRDDHQCQCGKFADRGIPCAHFYKACQSMRIPFENYVHRCYQTDTIRKALVDLHAPILFSDADEDPNIKGPPCSARNSCPDRHKAPYE